MGYLQNMKNMWFPGQQPNPANEIIPSILPAAAKACIARSILPQINTNTIMLSAGEAVHFLERAILYTEKTVTQSNRQASGMSFRVMKGMTYHTGRGQTTPTQKTVAEQTKGTLYITSGRIVFAAKQNGFEKKLKSLTTVTPYADAIQLQFGGTSYSLLLPDGNLAFAVIQLLKP